MERPDARLRPGGWPAALAVAAAASLLAACTPPPARELTDWTVDAEYRHDFEPLPPGHRTRVLVDRHHRTIYARPGDEHGAHVMLDILDRDGFTVGYADGPLDTALAEEPEGVLVIHGLPHDEIAFEPAAAANARPGEVDVFWRSPLSAAEVEAIVRWTHAGGGLLLALSHFPNGSGAAPLLGALGVGFRDGYAYHPDHPGDEPGSRCSHFTHTVDNGLLRTGHPLLAGAADGTLRVGRVRFLCGAAVFRRPDDVVLAFPPGTGNYLSGDDDPVERSDRWAGMIAFPYGAGRVVVLTDQGMFRNFVAHYGEERLYVTITDPAADNADLFVHTLRWLADLPRRGGASVGGLP